MRRGVGRLARAQVDVGADLAEPVDVVLLFGDHLLDPQLRTDVHRVADLEGVLPRGQREGLAPGAVDRGVEPPRGSRRAASA